jgi:hypothetical protein
MCRKTSVTEEPLPTTCSAEGERSGTCRKKPETKPSSKSTSVNVTIRGAVEAKAYIIFKMVYMEKSRLENNYRENNKEEHHDENFI